ncbi:exonuclease SbcCD subunit D, partial [Nicoliella lavandulae]
LHTADWHIGRRLHGFDLSEEQVNAFKQIERIAKDEHVDGIIIAGDLYDRSLPAESSVHLLNKMLKQLNLVDHYPLYAIAGNHDSATRLATGSEWFEDTQLFIHTSVAQSIEPIETTDTQLFLLPYFEPFEVRQFLDDDSIQHVDQAFVALVQQMKAHFNPAKRQVLVSHFFAAGSATTDSETKLTVGGLASVPLDVMQDFDYVALGHLHGKDAIHDSVVQYSGSPIKFSLSEAQQNKGVMIVDTDDIAHRRFIPLKPLHDVVELTGTFDELTAPSFYQSVDTSNYIGITITNRDQIPNLMARLRKIYPNIIELKRANGLDANIAYHGEDGRKIRQSDPMTLLANFYQQINDRSLTSDQTKWAKKTLKSVHQEEN